MTRTARESSRLRDAYTRRRQRGQDARYSLFEPAHLFQSQSLERALLRLLRREGYDALGGLRILDAGCGDSAWLRGLRRYGAQASDLIGIDLRPEAFCGAGEVHQLVATANFLPFASESFDLVCQFTMLSSILDAEVRQLVVAELLRVLRPSGVLLWYDFTVNPLNRDTRGIRPRELRALFAGAHVCIESVTLAPPLTRLLAPRSWAGCAVLEQIPWLRTHTLASVRKAAAPGSG